MERWREAAGRSYFGLSISLSLLLSISAAALEPIAEPAADVRLGHPSPAVDRVDQTYLMRFVRRVLVRRVRDDTRYEIEYVPPALTELSCRVAVTLREGGRLIGTGDSEALPVVEASRFAAEAALAAARERRRIDERGLAAMTLELELVGPRERVGHGNDPAPLLARVFEPAVHGIAVRVEGNEVLVRPSQLISKEVFCRPKGELDHGCDRYAIAIASFQDKLGLAKHPPERKPEAVVILRFRTMHLYEPRPGSEPVHLIAGMRIIGSDAVTPASLQAAADDVARFIRYRQQADGLFAYEFLPGRDAYWPKEQNWVRQAASVWATATHARQRDDEASKEALNRAIDAFRPMIQPLEGHPRAAFLATPDRKHPLGATALFCLALTDAPEPEAHEALRLSLLEGIASVQRDDGSFDPVFAGGLSKAGQDYYPGEALLALARNHALTRDAKWRSVCDKALPFYLDYFRKTRSPPFVPWHVQAWGQLARTTRLQKYADVVYEMSDFLADMQIEGSDPTMPVYDGAFDAYGIGRAGISTAVYTEGFIDAARTAAVMGDEARATRYREIVRRAARFVLQLRFREEECYYVMSPRDVVGGLRNTPIDPTLRIDHCQHALAALLGASELLRTGEADPTRPAP